MSRIGRLPVAIPSGVDITIDGQAVTVKGPKGELSHVVAEPITVAQGDGSLEVSIALLDRDGFGHDVAELALGALHLDGLAVDGDLDTARDGNRESSDTRHVESPYQT
jgi:hypothetical protein